MRGNATSERPAERTALDRIMNAARDRGAPSKKFTRRENDVREGGRWFQRQPADYRSNPSDLNEWATVTNYTLSVLGSQHEHTRRTIQVFRY